MSTDITPPPSEIQRELSSDMYLQNALTLSTSVLGHLDYTGKSTFGLPESSSLYRRANAVIDSDFPESTQDAMNEEKAEAIRLIGYIKAATGRLSNLSDSQSDQIKGYYKDRLPKVLAGAGVEGWNNNSQLDTTVAQKPIADILDGYDLEGLIELDARIEVISNIFSKVRFNAGRLGAKLTGELLSWDNKVARNLLSVPSTALQLFFNKLDDVGNMAKSNTYANSGYELDSVIPNKSMMLITVRDFNKYPQLKPLCDSETYQFMIEA